MLGASIFWMIPTPVRANVQNPQTTQAVVESVVATPIEQLPGENVQPADNNPVQKPAKKAATKTTGAKKTTKSSEPTSDIQILMQAKVIQKWGADQWDSMHFLLDHESGSNPQAVNPKSGACGIPQALPCSKLLKAIGTLDNVDGQLDWMIGYVSERYQNPTNAMNFWKVHHWY